jgi:subtilisin-like proprotein convertase family protein
LSSNIPKILPAFGDNQASARPLFKWVAPLYGTHDFILELSESSRFDSINWFKIITKLDSIAIPDMDLKINTVYFWRIRNMGGCSENDATISTFHTQSLTCKNYSATDLPKFISATGTPTVKSVIDVSDDFPLQLITIPSLRGSHDFIGDISISLKAPSGDSIKLWSNECNNLSNFNLSLDDLAPIGILCPLTDRKPHQPTQKLVTLNASQSKGQWTLSIQDNKSGSGGSLDEWSLQLCGSIEQNNPKPRIPPAISQFEDRKETITKRSLEYLDADSSPKQLKYSLLDGVGIGVFVLGGKDTLSIGSTFTQEDINSERLSFHSFLVRTDTIENVRIVIVDEKNNWSGVQTLTIKILNDSTIATKNIFDLQGILLYPNPFNHHLTLESKNTRLSVVELFNINGILVSRIFTSNFIINMYTDQLPSGVYIIKIWDLNKSKDKVFKAIKKD